MVDWLNGTQSYHTIKRGLTRKYIHNGCRRRDAFPPTSTVAFNICMIYKNSIIIVALIVVVKSLSFGRVEESDIVELILSGLALCGGVVVEESCKGK